MIWWQITSTIGKKKGQRICTVSSVPLVLPESPKKLPSKKRKQSFPKLSKACILHPIYHATPRDHCQLRVKVSKSFAVGTGSGISTCRQWLSPNPGFPGS